MALSAAFEFDAFINKAKEPLLQVLFSGGVVRNKKLQKGTILQLNSQINQDSNKGKPFKIVFNYSKKVRRNLNQLRKLFICSSFFFQIQIRDIIPSSLKDFFIKQEIKIMPSSNIF
jgi:hypothetical protein